MKNFLSQLLQKLLQEAQNSWPVQAGEKSCTEDTKIWHLSKGIM